MIFLVLYDQRGQCLRVASVNRQSHVQPFLDAGFIEVSESEFERCRAIVPEATETELQRIVSARRILDTTVERRQAPALNEQALTRLQNRQQTTYERITQQYLSDTLTVDQWERLFIDAINAGLGASTALGVGGLQFIDRIERQRIERDSRTQIGYLKRFKRDIDSLSSAQALNRAKSYANATTVRYWTAHTRAVGLPQLPAMPGVRTTCQSNCKCNWQIIELPGNGNWNLYWRISAVESCEECLRRQRVFNPLEIRNGIVQPFNPNGIYK